MPVKRPPYDSDLSPEGQNAVKIIKALLHAGKTEIAYSAIKKLLPNKSTYAIRGAVGWILDLGYGSRINQDNKWLLVLTPKADEYKRKPKRKLTHDVHSIPASCPRGVHPPDGVRRSSPRP
jgi:hypothetical protein